MNKKTYDVAIVGGGASGLAAAIMLGKKNMNVVVLERLPRTGKKLLATGNGQGNLTNIELSPSHYNDAAFAGAILARFGRAELENYYRSLGIELSYDEEGRGYPLCRQASAVLDLTLAKLNSLGVEIITEYFVTAIDKTVGGFTITDGKTEIFAKNVIIAAGGAVGKQYGTDGSIYKVLNKLGHTIVAPEPSLVQLKTETDYIKELKGVKEDALVSVKNGNKIVYSKRGEVLFTEYGVSGQAIFYASGYALRHMPSKIVLSFLPDLDERTLAQMLKGKAVLNDYLINRDWFSGYLKKQTGRAIIRRLGLALDEPINATNAEKLALAAKNFELNVVGSTGLNNAQVTCGGVARNEIDNKTLMSIIIPDLYFTGEVMDIDGDCGGYNLHFALSSAYVASEAITK